MKDRHEQENYNDEMENLLNRHKQINLEVTKQLTRSRFLQAEVEKKIGMSLSQIQYRSEKRPEPSAEKMLLAKKMVHQLLQQQGTKTATTRPPKNREMI